MLQREQRATLAAIDHADAMAVQLAEILALPEALERLSRLANAGCSRDRPEPTRLCASMLNIALSEMARVLQERFVTWVAPDDPAAVFRAVAEHHLMENKGSSSSTE